VSEADLPPPHPAQSIVELLALAWFLMLSPAERGRLLRILHWIAGVFSGPVKDWPLDFGRPLSQAEDEISASRSAAVWIARLAEQLKVVENRLPK
jgi:hypothetical protein